MSRTKPLIYAGQQRHGIRHAVSGDVAAVIKELLWDCPMAQDPPVDPRTFLATYCDEKGNEWPAVMAGNADDVWAIAGDGLEITVPLVPQILMPDARCEMRRFRCLVRDHSLSQDKILPLFTVVRQRRFPEMELIPLNPDHDLQIHRAQWVIDFKDMPDTGSRGIANLNI